MTKENTKSRSKKRKRNQTADGGIKKGEKEERLEPGEKENDRNRWNYREKQIS